MTSSLWRQPSILPQPLAETDHARVIHVAGAVEEREVLRGIELLKSNGVSASYDPNANAPSHYFAANAAQRQRDLERGLDDARVRALLCARGGYGSMKLLDALPPLANPERCPWLVGYSDITALHLWLNAQGVASIHGPLVSGYARYNQEGGEDSNLDDTNSDGGEELKETLRILRGGEVLGWEGLRTLHGGRASGRLIGGNLSLIQAMVGTSWLPHFDGAILLIEEISEAAYAIDRMLQSLALSGRARGLQGIVFGDFHNCKGIDERMGPEWLSAWTKVFQCPVVMGLPSGHGARNLPVVLGIDYTLDGDAGTLTPLPFASETAAQNDTNQTVRTSREHGPSAGDSSAQELVTEGEHRAARQLSAAARIVILPNEAPMGAGYFPGVSVAPSRLVATLTEMLDQGACSGLQLVASHQGQRTHAIQMGTTSVLDDAAVAPIGPYTRFDLASVSKAVGTALIAHALIEARVVALDDRIPEELSGSGATLAELLSHRSGLPAWERLYDDARQQDEPASWLRARYQQLERERPANEACVYSDPGYILLGWWLESIAGKPLDQLFLEHIARPLGLQQTGYLRDAPTGDARRHYAATEWCPWSKRTLQGVVHDEHTQVLGGVAGHAGLFSTALDVDRIAQSLLGFGPQLLRPETIATMWRKPDELCEGAYTLGWDTPTGPSSNAGSCMGATNTVGHLGYAGTSLWIDHERKIAITLLTNRVHPSRDAQMLRRFRPQVHDLVMRELLEPQRS